METTEKIVEAYVRYIKGWATIPNLKCKGQYEIDLIAVDASRKTTVHRYHIECSVSISGSYSFLTNKPFSTIALKTRVQQAGQRRTLGYFAERKFKRPEIIEKLKEYGFQPGNYKKIIVTWGWQDDVPAAAKEKGIVLWDFREILQEIADSCKSNRTYFMDDTMRTLQLMAKRTK